ncbi:unnamed protein product [Mytilus coruscus]|uniref:Uncharacterized protein n=1 Tax=Mytilus coruscus TaxID=42192 RepID=A0A6J8BTH1_MYTCO|nr:unnamed protein product [Mytilus coruscus]
MQASAIHNSLSQRQDAAMEDQNQMLNIMASLNMDEHTYNELTSIIIPLLERDRIRVQNCIVTVLQDEDNENIKSFAVVPLTPDRLREIGNNAFAENRYEDALQYYTEALRACQKKDYDHRILSNRSLVYLKVHEYTYAHNDANDSIEINLYFWKPHGNHTPLPNSGTQANCHLKWKVRV